jgi:two-component system osmolarity sensor histidine kinase EnvZ
MIINLYNKNFDFIVTLKENELFPVEKAERWFSPIDRSLRRELKPVFDSYWFDTTTYKEVVDLRLKYKNGVLQIFFPRHKIAPSSARIFALWITFPGLFLIFIAMIFLKNQTRPIVKLAQAAQKFGKGEMVEGFVPSGAREIRQAGYEFDRMRKRITAHLNQRSEMLSGISHDLRTPLTRLKLQLALLKQKDLSKKMGDDIDEMEKMLNEYLQFTGDQKKEVNQIINLNQLIDDILSNYDSKKISSTIEENIQMNGRYIAIKRCLINLIENGITYGEKVEIYIKKISQNIIIFVDDYGPGIPENERENALKPFYRIDKSRSQNKSGVGLGLSIANDIILSHGGNILLEENSHKGLRVKVSLPF